MTRPLRKSHCYIWIVLSMVLVVMIWAGLAGRRVTTPINEGLHLGGSRP